MVLTWLVAAQLWAQDPSWRKEVLLFWKQEQRDAAFGHMEKVFDTRTVKAGRAARPFQRGKALALGMDVDAYLQSQRSAGLLIIHKAAIRLERYGLGHSAKGRWASFSVAKSATSLLVGAALRDGAIRSLDDKVTVYLPAMKGSAYDDVTVRQLLTMTSGVRWNEDYTDPQSDVAKFGATQPELGLDQSVSYMRRLPREAPAGKKWVYKTGETNLIGALVSAAVGKPLSEYLSEKIWKPYGMETDAIWQVDLTGREVGGCCLAAALRDYARLGQFVLDGGMIRGRRVVAKGYLEQATSKQADIGAADRGYGYQWWTNADGTFEARGIYGQAVFVDPKRALVIAANSSWLKPTDRDKLSPERAAFFRAVQAAVDRE